MARKRKHLPNHRLPVLPSERIPILEARREAKMTSSAHAYVRGSTALFYEWLGKRKSGSLPEAPAIWIGGDCHVGNLGPVATAEGRIAIELRDLDQTVIGSPAHDVIRLALSMAMAVRASDLSGVVTTNMLEQLARGYERVFESKIAGVEPPEEQPPAPVTAILRASRRSSRSRLFQERFGGEVRTIPIGKRFWPLVDQERAAVAAFVDAEETRRLLARLTSRPDDASATLLDAAYWVKGCSSLGKWRAAALVEVGGAKDSVVALLDLKEAHAPLAPRAKKSRMPTEHGERVVTGARALSPSLGNRMAWGSLEGTPVFARELLPQDSKFELESLTEEEAITAGGYLASVVARAHARQLDVADAAAWLAEFRKSTLKGTSTPRWLWTSVVELVGAHESAYLEQCRVHGRQTGVTAQRNDDDVVEGTVTGA